MKKDDIELPPLPGYPDWMPDELAPRILAFLKDAQIEAIKADRQRRHEGANASEAYDVIDSFLRNNLDDDDYALYSKALDVVYAAPQLTEEVFCEECGDGLVVEDPGICGTCYQTKYVSPQTAEPVKPLSTDEVINAVKEYGNACANQSVTATELEIRLHGIRALLDCGGDTTEPVKVPSDEELVMLFSMWGWRTKDGRELRFSHFKEMVQILLARYGHNYQPRYKDDGDFHANATLPELDAWQRGWDACNTSIEAEGWQLVPKELIEFIRAKEHHLPIEDRHALSNMLKAAPKFGEEG